MLIAWCKYNFSPATELNSILNSIIWFNSEIQINNTPIFYQRCFAKGILYVKDIVNHRTKEFLSFEDFVAKYGKTITFVEYHGLISTIPKSFKQILQRNIQENNTVTSNYEKFIKKNWDSKYFYMKFIENKTVIPKLSVKWGNLLQSVVSEDAICKNFEGITTITLCTKLRSFLYRLTHFGYNARFEVRFFLGGSM